MNEAQIRHLIIVIERNLIFLSEELNRRKEFLMLSSNSNSVIAQKFREYKFLTRMHKICRSSYSDTEKQHPVSHFQTVNKDDSKNRSFM